MTKLDQLNKYLEYVNLPSSRKKEISLQMLPSVAVSRMAGSHGNNIIEKLLTRLKIRDKNSNWLVYDKTLLAKILEKNKWPKNYLQYLEDEKFPTIERAIEEMMGLHPSLELLQTRCNRTIKELANMGYAIIVGRGANFVLRNKENNLNIRLCGSLKARVKRFMETLDLKKPEAEKIILESDKKQKKFIKTWFKSDIEDPLNYDLVINTDNLNDGMVVDVLFNAITSLLKSPKTSPLISVFTQVV